MKTRFAYLAILILTALTMACSSGAQNTKPDYEFQLESQTDPKTNFDGIKTYGWLAAAGAVNDPSGKWNPPDVDFASDLQFLIERELRSRGVNAAIENPDVMMVYLVVVDMEAMKVVEERQGETNTQGLENLPQGAVVVQMIDTETGKALWTAGISAEVLENPTAEQTRKRLDQAVVELFKTYPASAK